MSAHAAQRARAHESSRRSETASTSDAIVKSTWGRGGARRVCVCVVGAWCGMWKIPRENWSAAIVRSSGAVARVCARLLAVCNEAMAASGERGW